MKAEAARPSPVSSAAGRRVPGEVAPNVARTRDRRDSRWDEHRRTRREQLVDATLTAIGRHGAGVGMEEIAAEAGTSKTVVYRHFADRTELHAAVCARVAAHLRAELLAATEPGGHPRLLLARAVETYLAFCAADPELYRFVVDTPEGVHRAPRPAPVDSLSALVADEVAALTAAALEQAGRDPAAAVPWGHGLVGLVRSAADWWLRAGRPMPRAELAGHLTDLAWAGLSGVVGTTPPSTGTLSDLEDP